MQVNGNIDGFSGVMFMEWCKRGWSIHEQNDAKLLWSVPEKGGQKDGRLPWTRAVAHTREKLPASFDQWFLGVQFDGLTDGVVSLRARDEFVRQWVENALLPTLTEYLRAESGLEHPGAMEHRWRSRASGRRPPCVLSSGQAAAVVGSPAAAKRAGRCTRRQRGNHPVGSAIASAGAHRSGGATYRRAQREIHVRQFAAVNSESAGSRGVHGGCGCVVGWAACCREKVFNWPVGRVATQSSHYTRRAKPYVCMDAGIAAEVRETSSWAPDPIPHRDSAESNFLRRSDIEGWDCSGLLKSPYCAPRPGP